jgi:hypothetical protein
VTQFEPVLGAPLFRVSPNECRRGVWSPIKPVGVVRKPFDLPLLKD